MLDPEAPDAAREAVANDAKGRIEGSGTLEKADSWGTRKLAYEIRRRNEAEYRYFRFEGGNDLLDQLNHSLRIADGVLRFRIFKVDPDTPMNPPPVSDRPAVVGDGRPDRGDRGDRGDRSDRGDRERH